MILCTDAKSNGFPLADADNTSHGAWADVEGLHADEPARCPHCLACARGDSVVARSDGEYSELHIRREQQRACCQCRSDWACVVKIFGIGLSRTGTYSLNRALELLGFRAKHFPRIEQNILSGNYQLDMLNTYDALTDTPVAPIFAQLDSAYPGSKFILTTRTLDAWLDACQKFFPWQDQNVGNSSFAQAVAFQRLYVYGCCTFNRDRWAYVYETHHRNVEHHFRARPGDLVVIDITAGDGWNVLCPFLGQPVPELAFPHVNAFRHFGESIAQSADGVAERSQSLARPATPSVSTDVRGVREWI